MQAEYAEQLQKIDVSKAGFKYVNHEIICSFYKRTIQLMTERQRRSPLLLLLLLLSIDKKFKMPKDRLLAF
jgi:hypothetical protein